jgi:APA family basic amino acid/polyamine antiporter
MAAKIEVWDANWVDAWGSKSFDRATEAVPIGGTMLISAISAALVGSISRVWLGKVTFIV